MIWLLRKINLCIKTSSNGYVISVIVKSHEIAPKAQRPRTDLSKKSLPRPKTTTAWKLIPHRSNIYQQELKSSTVGTFLLSKMSLNVITLKLISKNQFL